MHGNINRELLKIKIYDQVSRYLRYPSAFEKQQLHVALLEYKELFDSGDIVSTLEHELDQVLSQ